MTLAAVARLSRRHLPVLVSQSRLGGARSAALVHETGRLSSPTPHLPLGRLLPCPPHQPGGVLPRAPLLQSQRFMCSGGKKPSGGVESVHPDCMAKEIVSLMRELAETSASLDRDLNIYKNMVILLFGVALASMVTLPVEISSMRKEKIDLCRKVRKTNTKSAMVVKEMEVEHDETLELQKWFGEELAKRRG